MEFQLASTIQWLQIFSFEILSSTCTSHMSSLDGKYLGTKMPNLSSSKEKTTLTVRQSEKERT
jgi:hypothetical protein